MSFDQKGSLPELLAPAGTFEKLPFALRFGADAVYLAGKAFGMRAAAGNFSDEEMRLAIRMAHSFGKKVYLTLNTMPRDSEINALTAYLENLSEMAPDAVIVSDMGVLSLCKKYIPDVEIHISTQASTVNAEACKVWHSLGAKRIVLARELSLFDLENIKKRIPDDLELEVFVHGSMCVAYSGRCLLSNYFTGRDANRGACTQPCRWSYHFAEDSRPGEPMTVESGEEGSFIFGSKDLCMIDHLQDLCDVGIDSLKIEGRMKSAYYCAVVTNVYRMELDAIAEKRTLPDRESVWKELNSVSHREYDTGFFYERNMNDPKLVSHNGYEAENSFLAEVKREVAPNLYLCEQKNKFSVGDTVEALRPGEFGQKIRIFSMKDDKGETIHDCPHPKMLFVIQTDSPIREGDLIRRTS